MSTEENASRLLPVESIGPWRLAGIVAVLSLIAAPFFAFPADLKGFWTRWALATGGVSPWGVYTQQADYPALVPYLLTLAEAVRRMFNAEVGGKVFLVAMKLPNILAHVLAGILCWKGLAAPFGQRNARLAGILYILSPALFVNAAMWAQYDALLSFLMVAVLIAALNDRPVLAGALMGLALATKFQAVVAGPVLLVHLLRRYRLGTVMRSALSGLGVIALVTLPHVLAGQGPQLLTAYTGAVDHWPRRTNEAFNLWYLLDCFDHYVWHVPFDAVRNDSRLAMGLISFKHIGLILFGGYVVWSMIVTWRRPTDKVFVFAQVMSGYAFFMLPTQMHERYSVPAATMAALLAPLVLCGMRLYVGLTFTCAINQLLVMWRFGGSDAPLPNRVTLVIGVLIALANLVLFAWSTALLWKDARGTTDEVRSVDESDEELQLSADGVA